MTDRELAKYRQMVADAKSGLHGNLFHVSHVEKLLKEIERRSPRSAFEGGWHAGKDYLQPPMGPGFYAKDSEEAYQHWLRS